MRRHLIPSGPFLRSAKRLARKNLQQAKDLEAALNLLSEDAFSPKLKTHKLKGKLERSWACSAGYDLRIVFQFVSHENSDAILLERVGTHDEVY
ncbi:MAG: type II toxin-antitoxin system RelE/ParE family toxin [Limisphaerales bacterium]